MTPEQLFEDFEKSKEEFKKKRLQIARIAFREIDTIIIKWEKHDIDFSWERAIEVDDEIFYEDDLIEADE